MRSIYFDYNATTPLEPQVREAMLPYLGEIYGNPSSVHHVGRRARSLLDDARHRVAQVWRCKASEVVFTSGGTESNNLAIFGAARRFRDKGRHIITTAIEHHAVLHPCEYLVDKEGFEEPFLFGLRFNPTQSFSAAVMKTSGALALRILMQLLDLPKRRSDFYSSRRLRLRRLSLWPTG